MNSQIQISPGVQVLLDADTEVSDVWEFKMLGLALVCCLGVVCPTRLPVLALEPQCSYAKNCCGGFQR